MPGESLTLLKYGVHNFEHECERKKKAAVETQQIKEVLTQLKRCLTKNTKAINHEQDMKEDI